MTNDAQRHRQKLWLITLSGLLLALLIFNPSEGWAGLPLTIALLAGWDEL